MVRCTVGTVYNKHLTGTVQNSYECMDIDQIRNKIRLNNTFNGTSFIMIIYLYIFIFSKYSVYSLNVSCTCILSRNL